MARPSIIVDVSTKTVGFKEGSGFTHAINVEPITYRPTESFRYSVRAEICAYVKSHSLVIIECSVSQLQTNRNECDERRLQCKQATGGQSKPKLTDTSRLLLTVYAHFKGSEYLQRLAARAQDETGYTTGNRAKPLFTPRTLDEVMEESCTHKTQFTSLTVYDNRDTASSLTCTKMFRIE